ncbi:MAG: HAD family hydrolase [Coriobacteriales bacterium]|nr:HAD family hydrolase [Coriobacteriales bacterium]
MQYTTVVFDLDGTLLNTLDDLHASTNYALTAYGFPTRTMSEVRSFVGNGIRNLIRLAVPAGSSDEVIDTVHATFDEHYAAHHLDKTAPYPEVIDLVQRLRLRGFNCCVVSNKGDYAVQPLVEHFFPGLFDVVCGEREKDGIRRKPWPDTVLECMQRVGATPDECVYVGDSEVDLLTAANAGIDCIEVSWGFRDVEFLVAQGAQVIVHNANELQRAIERA